MGEVRVPADAYYGAQTQRAVDNFQISGLRMPREFIRALGLVKWAAAGPMHRSVFWMTKLAEAIQQGGRRGHRRQVGRTFSHRHFPDRFRHFDQHEYK